MPLIETVGVYRGKRIARSTWLVEYALSLRARHLLSKIVIALDEKKHMMRDWIRERGGNHTYLRVD